MLELISFMLMPLPEKKNHDLTNRRRPHMGARRHGGRIFYAKPQSRKEQDEKERPL
jgi:hypothetical protein